MGNCRDIGDQQELEPPPDVPPNEVRDKKRLRRPKIRPQRWPRKIKRRPEIKGDVCVEMKFAPPTFFLSSVPFRETTPILQNRKKKPTFPGKLSGLKNEASVFKLDEEEMARLAEGIERAIMKFCD